MVPQWLLGSLIGPNDPKIFSGLNAKAKFHYRSLSYAWYRCRLSFTLLRLLPSKGGCATTLCTDLPSATFSILALL
jgi:hypothetical protein